MGTLYVSAPTLDGAMQRGLILTPAHFTLVKKTTTVSAVPFEGSLGNRFVDLIDSLDAKTGIKGAGVHIMAFDFFAVGLLGGEPILGNHLAAVQKTTQAYEDVTGKKLEEHLRWMQKEGVEDYINLASEQLCRFGNYYRKAHGLALTCETAEFLREKYKASRRPPVIMCEAAQ